MEPAIKPPKTVHQKTKKIFAALLESLGLNTTDLARELSSTGTLFSQQLIATYVSGSSKSNEKVLEAIVLRYPKINAHWLLTGKGEPFPAGRYNEQPTDQLPPQVPSKLEPVAPGEQYPPMTIVGRTEAEETRFWRTQYEREAQAHERTRNQGHERESQLIVTIGNLGKAEASDDTADSYVPANMGISYVNPDLPALARFVPKAADSYRRPVIEGFVAGSQR